MDHLTRRQYLVGPGDVMGEQSQYFSWSKTKPGRGCDDHFPRPAPCRPSLSHHLPNGLRPRNDTAVPSATDASPVCIHVRLAVAARLFGNENCCMAEDWLAGGTSNKPSSSPVSHIRMNSHRDPRPRTSSGRSNDSIYHHGALHSRQHWADLYILT